MKPFHALRIRFAEAEMSQNQVAREIGIAESTMTARMTGTQPFTAWEIAAAGKLLGIPPEEYHKYFFGPAKKGVKS